jgi:hypothetical protein
MARIWVFSRCGRHRLTRARRAGPGPGSPRRDRQIGRGLVAADVQRADDQRLAVQGRGDGLVLAGLLVLVGRSGALEEQELGAQQARALRAVGRGGQGVVQRADIAEHLDALAVPCTQV